MRCYATLICVLAVAPAATADDRMEFFESRIRPVLTTHCYECHNSSDTAEGDLVLDFRGGVLKGGAGGPIVVPGKPESSRLIAILKHEIPGLEMPSDGPQLSAAVIADVTQWIRDGAADPRNAPPTAA
jgi:mono/diheme cytochrome c family protein